MESTLFEAFKQTKYQISGQGFRKVQVLKDALDGIDGEQDSDLYGSGEVIRNFENKMANFLGKEAAVFFPSGTMAQQIALRIWCDQKGLPKVAYHPLCHLEIHEEDGLKELHRIEPILLADKTSVIELEDVVNLKEDISCLLLELPQREIGGQLPSYETLEAISTFCRENGIKLHLDGARLLEVLPYYQKTAVEICELFDSVYISFYKTIGGVAGAILAGEKSFIEQSKIWKRRHGGDLISLYPYIISADYYFDRNVNKMEKYYHQAKELAALINGCPAVSTLPEVPVSNMFHVHFQVGKEELEQLLLDLYNQTNIGLAGNLKEINESSSYLEVSIGDQYEKIPKEALTDFFQILEKKILGINN